MAFKINTQAYQVCYPKPIPNPPVNKVKEEAPIKNIIQTSNPTTKLQVKFPSHNLLNKYNAAGSYYNFQSALNKQFGIKNNHTNFSDEGQKALIENLQQQSNAFNYGVSSRDSNLSWSDALGQYLSLEDITLQKKLQEQQTQQVQNDFLNALVWNLKKNLTL